MAILTKDAILGKKDTQVEDVPVPEWSSGERDEKGNLIIDFVRVRGMTGTEREAFENSIRVEKPAGNRAARRRGETITDVKRDYFRARICAWCIVDEKGDRVFGDEDLPLLNAKSAAALERIMKVAMRISGMDDDDIDQMAQEMVENPFEDTSSA